MTRHRCFEVTTPAGHVARIHGNPEMPGATLDALMRMMDLAYEQFSAIQVLDEAQSPDGAAPAPSTVLHNSSAVLCAVPDCGIKRSGSSRYCKKHDMRWRCGSDPAIDPPRGRPRKR